jgi:hypothetical protein
VRSWPARPPLQRPDEILTPGVYWPPEELEDTDEDAYFLEHDSAPERDGPAEQPEPADDIPDDLLDPPSHDKPSPVDVADASDVADAMDVPMPGADHTHPPILDADAGGEWPAWNGRGPHDSDQPAEDDDGDDGDDGDKDPVVVEGDMSDTVARLVEDMKGWNKG